MLIILMIIVYSSLLPYPPLQRIQHTGHVCCFSCRSKEAGAYVISNTKKEGKIMQQRNYQMEQEVRHFCFSCFVHLWCWMNVFVTVEAALVVSDTIVHCLAPPSQQKRLSGQIHIVLTLLLLPSPQSTFNIPLYLLTIQYMCYDADLMRSRRR